MQNFKKTLRFDQNKLKYNTKMLKEFEKTQQKDSLISLDWLSVSVKTRKIYKIEYENQIINVNKYLELRSTRRQTPMFKNVFDVIYKGMLVATLETNPKGGILGENHCILKFNNEILFTDNLKKLYYRMKYAIGFQFEKFNKIDIAVDTLANGQEMKLFKKFTQDKIRFKGNSKVSAQWNAKNELEYFRIGSKKSDKFVRCYYKRQEIAKSGKTYIEDFYNKNGFDSEKEVFRVELCLSTVIMNKITMPEFDIIEDGNTFVPFMNEKTIELLENNEFLGALFNQEAGEKIQYIKTKEFKEKKRANRCKSFALFSFKYCKNIFKFSRIKNETSKYIHRTKITAKMMYEAFLETKQKVYIDLCFDLCHNANLTYWANKNCTRWENEYLKRKKNPIYKQFISMLNDTVYIQKRIA